MERQASMSDGALEEIALLVTDGRRIGLTIAPSTTWHTLSSYTMLLLQAPHQPYSGSGAPLKQALALAQGAFGHEATAAPSPWTYGASARHAVDRMVAADNQAPLLRFDRFDLVDGEELPRRIPVGVYRAQLRGDVSHGANGAIDPQQAAAALWAPLAALRTVIRGAPLADLLSMADVSVQLAPGVTLPADGMVYLRGEYGERRLLRVAAKYGDSAIVALSAALRPSSEQSGAQD